MLLAPSFLSPPAQPADFDNLLAALMDIHPDHPVIFNCQMGIGRTTTGMVIASLVHVYRAGQLDATRCAQLARSLALAGPVLRGTQGGNRLSAGRASAARCGGDGAARSGRGRGGPAPSLSSPLNTVCASWSARARVSACAGRSPASWRRRATTRPSGATLCLGSAPGRRTTRRRATAATSSGTPRTTSRPSRCEGFIGGAGLGVWAGVLGARGKASAVLCCVGGWWGRCCGGAVWVQPCACARPPQVWDLHPEEVDEQRALAAGGYVGVRRVVRLLEVSGEPGSPGAGWPSTAPGGVSGPGASGRVRSSARPARLVA